MYMVHSSQVRKRAKQNSLVCTWCIYFPFLHTLMADPGEIIPTGSMPQCILFNQVWKVQVVVLLAHICT